MAEMTTFTTVSKLHKPNFEIMVLCAQNMECNITRLILDIQEKKINQIIIKQLTIGPLQLYLGDQGCCMNYLFIW